MKKIALTALISTAACFGITATTGFATHLAPHHSHGHNFTVRIGDDVTIPSVDLFCTVRDLVGGSKGGSGIIYCGRASTHSPNHSRAIVANKYHLWITDESGNHIASLYNRAP